MGIWMMEREGSVYGLRREWVLWLDDGEKGSCRLIYVRRVGKYLSL